MSSGGIFDTQERWVYQPSPYNGHVRCPRPTDQNVSPLGADFKYQRRINTAVGTQEDVLGPLTARGKPKTFSAFNLSASGGRAHTEQRLWRPWRANAERVTVGWRSLTTRRTDGRPSPQDLL